MGRRLAAWTRFVLYAVLAGALVATAALPAALVAGAVALTAADSFDRLPSVLATPTPPQTSRLYAADGTTLIASFADEDRTDVPLSSVAPVMRQAIVAAEDARFYQRGAVDLRGVLRALVADSRSGRTGQGASTLTMQYVRNVLKTDPGATAAQRADATADTVGRKLREVRYAAALEKALTKDQILERYLNIAYFGAGAYGIEAAANTYFSTTAERLTLTEAALLAGLVQSPDRDDPIHGDAASALTRRAYVLDAMVRNGDISRAAASQTAGEPIGLAPAARRDGCADAATADGGFFCAYLVSWWQQQPAFGATPEDRLGALRQGGYRIVGSLDPDVQATATAAALSVYGYSSQRALPIAAIEPGTGRILAMAVNRHYSVAPDPPGQQAYPNTVNQLVAGGGSVSGYPAGSTFKLFTMLAALTAGLPLDTGFDAPSRLVTSWRSGDPAVCGGYYCPANDNPQWMDGYRTMWTGFGRSVNTYFAWLEQRVGADRAVAMAQLLGITFRARSDEALATGSPAEWGSFTLGVADTTPLDLANAYATVAAEGTYCVPLPVNAITDAAGAAVAAGQPACRRVLDPDVARAATDAARCPVGQQGAYGRCDGGTASEVAAMFGGRPIAGKTGSSERNTTESFVAFTPQAAVAGIAADPASAADGVGAAIQPRVVRAVASVLARAVRALPARDFVPPSRRLAFGAGAG
jgi:membrane peptidoglycan carboxypeptidase